MTKQHIFRRGFTLTELMAALAIIGIVATIVLVRATAGGSASKSAACQSLKGDIEVQCELWRHQVGSWPAANLANIGADANYFPAGLPVCPVDGSAYTIDTTGRVVGHSH
jgi:general secretion pathway protein G